MASDASGDLEQQELPQGGRHWTAARGDRERAPRGGRHKARDFLALQALIALIINIHSDPLAPQNLNPGQDSTRRTDDTGGYSTRNSSPGPKSHHCQHAQAATAAPLTRVHVHIRTVQYFRNG